MKHAMGIYSEEDAIKKAAPRDWYHFSYYLHVVPKIHKNPIEAEGETAKREIGAKKKVKKKRPRAKTNRRTAVRAFLTSVLAVWVAD